MIDYKGMVTRLHPDPKYHIRMPMESRAAQFAPFAALSGYEEAVEEAHRLTENRPELSEDEKYRLDLMLQQILTDNSKEVVVTYFIPDQQKNGGNIIIKADYISRIDEYNQMLILRNGDVIPLNDILSLNYNNNEKDLTFTI